MAKAAMRMMLACAGAALVAVPAGAQTLEELDQLVQSSAKPKPGLALALATLERVLAAEPKHKAARLLHASILCRLDDADGAKLEFARLKTGDYKKAEWAEAVAPCNSLKEPGA
jgi:hypothetical protein